MEWTDDQVLLLIELYRERPVLWDCRNVNYKNKIKRHDALVEIAAILEVSKEEINKKIHNLLSHFARQMKKEKDSNKSGSGSDVVYKSKWFCYNAMTFLKDRNKPNKTTDTEEIEENVSEKRQDEDDKSEEVEGIGEKSGSSSKRAVLPSQTSPVSIRKPRKSNIPHAQAMVDNAYTIMQEIYAKKSERDEYSIFGEQVACKLRKLESEHAKAVVQQIINTILFEAHLGKYNHTLPTYDQILTLQVNQYTPTNTPLFSTQSLSNPLLTQYPGPNVFTHTDLNSSGSNIPHINQCSSSTAPKIVSVLTLPTKPDTRRQTQTRYTNSTLHKYTAVTNPSDSNDSNISNQNTPSPVSNYSQKSESTIPTDEDSIEYILSTID